MHRQDLEITNLHIFLLQVWIGTLDTYWDRIYFGALGKVLLC